MRRLLFVLGLIALSGCATTAHKADPLCSQIAAFANATQAGEKQSIELKTDWGGTWSQNKNVLAEKSCDGGGHEAGGKFCRYLLENTSTEFADINFSIALSCLGKRLYMPAHYYDLSWQSADVSTDLMPGVNEDVTVSLHFNNCGKCGPPSLVIAAERRKQ